ncbi:coiled-coil domain-containing protein 42 homolog [Myxocyprinus asiaticus]|uniref:coiled-coil domain-containing protein 42 homolog n=1 Tax=Myxocyprinus asiaticus TaxID=70543 RepID=UPI0022218889|nr:coiled-coil domain-containing protein 42 homolog [Myxocyprinus asiaticus]
MEVLSFPHLKLTVQNRKKNIFVTQLDEYSERKDECITHLPVIKECSSVILESGVNTLQSTLLLKKQMQLEKLNKQLMDKHEEVRGRMQILQQKRAELQLRQQETKHRAAQFEKFVEENEVKRRCALKKFHMERQQNEYKEKEKAELSAQLEQLQARRRHLKEKVKKYKIYEEFLFKVLDLLPDNYLGSGPDLVTPLMRRFETLYISRQDLLQKLSGLTEQLKNEQQNLDALKQQHNTHKLMSHQKLNELQTQLDHMREKNKQLEMMTHLHQGQSREQVEEVGNILIAVKNLAEQCYLHHYGALEDMDVCTMMDMIKEFIVEKSDLVKRAMRLSDSRTATSMRNTSSKILLKSSSRRLRPDV